MLPSIYPMLLADSSNQMTFTQRFTLSFFFENFVQNNYSASTLLFISYHSVHFRVSWKQCFVCLIWWSKCSKQFQVQELPARSDDGHCRRLHAGMSEGNLKKVSSKRSGCDVVGIPLKKKTHNFAGRTHQRHYEEEVWWGISGCSGLGSTGTWYSYCQISKGISVYQTFQTGVFVVSYVSRQYQVDSWPLMPLQNSLATTIKKKNNNI